MWPRARAGQVHGHGVHCMCRPYGVHGMAHVLALDARSRVLRGNISGHRLSSCGYPVLRGNVPGPIVGVLGRCGVLGRRGRWDSGLDVAEPTNL